MRFVTIKFISANIVAVIDDKTGKPLAIQPTAADAMRLTVARHKKQIPMLTGLR